MSSRLRDLKVTKVDFVDDGDNKMAHVLLFKRAQPPANQEGEVSDMKIDKSKLTPEELATLAAIEKKAGIPDQPPVNGDTPPDHANGQNPAPTVKSAPDAPVTRTDAPSAPAGDTQDDIYKGLHPAVREELERLKKRADDADERELIAVAKKYELLGKKPEELLPVLKSLKAAGGSSYDEMIAVLDASLQAVEKAGVFSEIGKTGGAGSGGATDAWSLIQKHAEKLREADPAMDYNVAIDKACQAHPELVSEYEANR